MNFFSTIPLTKAGLVAIAVAAGTAGTILTILVRTTLTHSSPTLISKPRLSTIPSSMPSSFIPSSLSSKVPSTDTSTNPSAITSKQPSALPPIAPTKKKRTNVILIIIDDLGIHDLGTYGSTFHDTPNIDNLARDGVKFLNAYSAHPRCLPARVAIFSGIYPARLGSPVPGMLSEYGHKEAFTCMEKKGYFKTNLPITPNLTLGEAFKSNGYSTAYVGKWHIGSTKANDSTGSPLDQGFDSVASTNLKGAVKTHFSPYMPLNVKDDSYNLINATRMEDGTYSTDQLTVESIKFLKDFKMKDKPFLLVLSHYAVHTPLQAPDSIVQFYKKKKHQMREEETDQVIIDQGVASRRSQDNEIYAAMMKMVDDSVGKIREELKKNSMDESTSIVLTSDNGGMNTVVSSKYSSNPANAVKNLATSNYPNRFGKGWLYNGGLRVPLIIYAPGRKKVTDASIYPTIGTDIYPTMLELVGLPLIPSAHLDGKSLVPFFTDGNTDELQEPRPLFWDHPRATNARGDPISSAVLVKGWKLIDLLKEDDLDKKFELYNLTQDPKEMNNLAKDQPEIVKHLTNTLLDWKNNLVHNKKYKELLNNNLCSK